MMKPQTKLIIQILLSSLVIIGCGIILGIPVWPDPPVNRFIVLFTLIISLWTIAVSIPMWVVSLSVPILAVLLRVMRDPQTGVLLNAYEAATTLVRSMFSFITLVLLGAFTVSVVVTKYQVAKLIRIDQIVRSIYDKMGIGTLLAFIMVGSLWLSIIMPHEVVLVLMLTAVDRLLYDFDHAAILMPPNHHSNNLQEHNPNHSPQIRNACISNLSKALISSIMVGCEIGGMMSPVSSPQNIFAYQGAGTAVFHITWTQWLIISIPTTHLAILPCWITIMAVYGLFGHDGNQSRHNPNSTLISTTAPIDPDTNSNPNIIAADAIVIASHEQPTSPISPTPLSPSNQSLSIKNCYPPDGSYPISTGKSILATILVVITILFWASTVYIERWFGNLGIISTIPFILFFGTGLLDERDFAYIPWDVLLLSLGGVALSVAAKSSGFFAVLGEYLRQIVSAQGQIGSAASVSSVWVKSALCALIVTAFSTFKSHFVTALVFLPIISAIYGSNVTDPAHGNWPSGGKVIYFITTLACTSGMALPISGLINMAISSLSPRNHASLKTTRYLNRLDFVKIGLPASLFALLSILSVGFALSRYLVY